MSRPVSTQHPPAVAGSVGRHELLATLVERQLRLRAKRSVLGVAWPLVAPVLLFVLYLAVFGSVFDVPVDDYWVYLMAGLLPWSFLVQTVHDSLQSISFEPELVRRAPFPYETLPLSRVVVMAVPFTVHLLAAVVAIAVGRGLELTWLPLLVVPVTSMVLITSALTLLVSLIDVFNRDLRYVLTNVMTVWFFLMPILYTASMRTTWLDGITRVDPMRAVIEQFHDLLYHQEPGPLWGYAVLLAASTALFALALVVFRRGSVDLAQDI